MSKVLIEDSYLEDIADSIRAKNGTSDTYKPKQMSTAIDNLPTGSKFVLPNGTKFSSGTFSNLDFLEDADMSQLTTMNEMFKNCYNITSVDLDVSNITNMSVCFQYCTSLESAVLRNTNKVTSMSQTFTGCSKLTNINIEDTSNVTNFDYCFNGCNSLVTFPQLDVSNATAVSQLCRDCSNLVNFPILNFKKASITMQAVWDGCPNLSNESLNNIMASLIGVTSSWYKTLKWIGFTQAQVNVMQTLSNYDALIADGWTTGY